MSDAGSHVQSLGDIQVSELVWEAARARAAEDGIGLDDAVRILLRAYAYGRLSVVSASNGKSHIVAAVEVP